MMTHQLVAACLTQRAHFCWRKNERTGQKQTGLTFPTTRIKEFDDRGWHHEDGALTLETLKFLFCWPCLFPFVTP